MSFIGYDLHEKGLQRRQGVNLVSSSSERRTTIVSSINDILNSLAESYFFLDSMYVEFNMLVLLNKKHNYL